MLQGGLVTDLQAFRMHCVFVLGPFWTVLGSKVSSIYIQNTSQIRTKTHTKRPYVSYSSRKPGRGVRERKERGFCRRPKLSQQPKQRRPNPQLSSYVSPICVASHNVVVDGGRQERPFTLGSMQSAGGYLRRHEVRGSLWGSLWGCGYCVL